MMTVVSEKLVSARRAEYRAKRMPFPKTSYSGPFTLVINISALNLTSEQFARFCEDNRDLRIEKTAQGELIIMAPAFPETSRKNARIATRLGIWAEQDNTGVYFESSGGFTLPNGAERSPDAAWILRERYEALPMPQRAKRYAPIAPDFVIELRSESDRLKPLQAKMEEYVDNGVRLGWLIDPKRKKVYVYRPEAATEVLHNPKSVSGEDVLPGFVLQLAEIW